MKVGVIGCGIIGLFTAYFLRARGFDVVIICRDLPGSSSKANGGIITVSFTPAPWPGFLRLLRALLSFGGPLAIDIRELDLRWLVEAYRARGGRVDVLKVLARRSLELYKNIVRELDVEYYEGVLALYARLEDAETHVKLHGGRLVDNTRLRELGFEGFEAGVLAEDEIALDPLSLLEALWGFARGCEVVDRVAVGLEPIGGKVRVALENGDTRSFDAVVVASGAWSSRVLEKLKVRIPLKPARGLAFLARVEKPPVGAPAILEDYGVVISPIPRGFTRISSFFELKGFSLEWSEERLKWLRGVISRHVPSLKGYEFENPQTGFRPCTPDMIPVIGELPNARGIYVAIGHCRLGVTLAPVTGELVTSMISGVKPPLPEDILGYLSPTRFLSS